VKPRDVECPHCMAKPGQPCMSRTRRGRPLTRGVHTDRERAAEGTYAPTTEYLLRKEIAAIRRRVAEKMGVGS
jgi:hypothetical protein